MTTEATQDAPTDASYRPAVAGQVERSVRRPSLSAYTDAELLAEVARRRKERERTKPTKWCDECEHFSGRVGDGRVLANPCGKGHKMLFLMPDGPADVEWGYYLRWCQDRREKPDLDA
jgi:hypothetical protein